MSIAMLLNLYLNDFQHSLTLSEIAYLNYLGEDFVSRVTACVRSIPM